MTEQSRHTLCRTCGGPIDFGFDATFGRWIPLEPISSDSDLPKTFVDENDVYRADHRDRHKKNGSGVNIVRLAEKIPPDDKLNDDGKVIRSRKMAAARRKRAI